MERKYFDQEDINIEELEKIAEEIRRGKIVIFPTETVYGIGTNALDEKACTKIYEIKGRIKEKPLIVLVSNKKMLEDIVININEIERKLMEAFWPGPLTIIFHRKKDGPISKVVTGGKEDVGVRMTDGKIANMLIEMSGVPIVAPSANLSGKSSGTKIKDMIEDLGDKVDYIMDCGDIKDETTSTLVKVEDGVIHILRQGKISKERLEKIAEVKIR